MNGVSPPLPSRAVDIGNLGYRQFWTQIKSWDTHPPPPYQWTMGIWVLGSFGLNIESGDTTLIPYVYDYVRHQVRIWGELKKFSPLVQTGQLNSECQDSSVGC